MSLRILRVAQKCYPDVTGGGAYHVHAMSRDQAAMGHDVTVVTVRQNADDPEVEQRDGYTIRRHDPTVSLLGNDLSLGVARELRRTDAYDVVHAHSHLYASTNLAAVARALGETPLAITNHGLYSQSAPRWLFDAYLRTVGRWTFNAADEVFTYTESERARLRDLGVATDVAVVPNGIDTERFTPEGPVDERLAGDRPTVLFVGRLVEGKRPGDALDAFERVSREQPDVGLVVVGEGPQREQLERQVVDEGLEGDVRFLGQVPYDKMPAIYRGADLLVLPSESEGFPRTVLEALATETPVVASALDQLRELSGEGLCQVEVGDTVALARTVSDLLADEAGTCDLSRTGRSAVLECHDWRDTVRATTACLERLATR